MVGCASLNVFVLLDIIVLEGVEEIAVSEVALDSVIFICAVDCTALRVLVVLVACMAGAASVLFSVSAAVSVVPVSAVVATDVAVDVSTAGVITGTTLSLGANVLEASAGTAISASNTIVAIIAKTHVLFWFI
jgi:hypothetical protein